MILFSLVLWLVGGTFLSAGLLLVRKKIHLADHRLHKKAPAFDRSMGILLLLGGLCLLVSGGLALAKALTGTLLLLALGIFGLIAGYFCFHTKYLGTVFTPRPRKKQS